MFTTAKKLAATIAGAAMVMGAALLPARAADLGPGPYVPEAGPFRNFQVRLGATGVLWNDDNKGIYLNNALVGGAGAHVEDIILPTATLSYYFTPNIAAELFCCFAHAQVKADGTLRTALGQDKVANTWTFPPIVTLQYHFTGMGAIKPYIGAGVQWIHYFKSDSDLDGGLGAFNKVKFDDSFGPVVQAGLDIAIGGGWSVGFDMKYAWLDTKLTFRDGAGNVISTKHQLDPLILTANIGYRFNLEDLLGHRAASYK